MLNLSSVLGAQVSHSGEANWHIKRRGQNTGPVTDLELACLAHANYLQATDLIWCKGMPDWVPAGSVTGLLPRPLPGALPPLLPPRPQTGLAELYQHYCEAMQPLPTFDARMAPPLSKPEVSRHSPAQPASEGVPDMDALSTSLADALRAVERADAHADQEDRVSHESQDALRPAAAEADAPQVAASGASPSVPDPIPAPAPAVPPPIPAATSMAAKFG